MTGLTLRIPHHWIPVSTVSLFQASNRDPTHGPEQLVKVIDDPLIELLDLRTFLRLEAGVTSERL